MDSQNERIRNLLLKEVYDYNTTVMVTERYVKSGKENTILMLDIINNKVGSKNEYYKDIRCNITDSERLFLGYGLKEDIQRLLSVVSSYNSYLNKNHDVIVMILYKNNKLIKTRKHTIINIISGLFCVFRNYKRNFCE